MNNSKNYNSCIIIVIFIIANAYTLVNAQQNFSTHTRGKLWETLYNWGFIGDPGAWDYLETTGIGFYPGFSGFNYPHDEQAANGYITDANFHNFRSGPWIIVKGANTPVPPAYTPQAKDFLIYESAIPTPLNPDGVLSSIEPFTHTLNFIGTPNFNSLLPEEMNSVTYQTATGITVTQHSYSWSYPGYSDFIIYDYTFKNTGDVAIPSVNKIVHYDQTLNEVWLNFWAQLHVSTKGFLNFHYNSDFLSSAAPAGGFGWHPGSGYNNYYSIENQNTPGEGMLYYSWNYNGGREPVPWDKYGLKSNWQQLLTLQPGWLPELQDPAAFGFVDLYISPQPQGSINTDPFQADPTHFSVYSDEADKFDGKTVDFETFGENTFSLQELYNMAKTDYMTANNGRDYTGYLSAFGPYKLAPGDSVRLIIAEVAGELDLKQVVMGDPNHWFPDSTFAAIRRNTIAARNAVKWGIGATVNGIPLAASVPPPPPAPNCNAANASKGSDSAIIAIQWDKLSETTKITDGSGKVFFDGSTDVSGYRIFRGTDKRGVWYQIADIPRSQFTNYWNSGKNEYQFLDRDLQFGFEYYYYVQAYNSQPRPWTSANGTLVNNLPELASGDYNHTVLTGASPGPVDVSKKWDVFVAPNPYVEGDPNRSFGGATPQKIEFRNLPQNCIIKIFTLSGDLIKTLIHQPDQLGNLSGSEAWDQRSDSGLLVAPGLYIYVVQSQTVGSEGSKFVGKLMIIR
ncbi:MAG: hypothetical protein ACYDA4_05205 [Ignavibacteriaceae bacterium]